MLQKYRPSSKRRGKESVSSPASTSSTASDCDLRETFDVFDKDADGYLNAVDLRSVVRFFVHDCFTSWLLYQVSLPFLVN